MSLRGIQWTKKDLDLDISKFREWLILVKLTAYSTPLLGDHSKMEPPDPISNSVVKRFSADGSVGVPMWE